MTYEDAIEAEVPVHLAVRELRKHDVRVLVDLSGNCMVAIGEAIDQWGNLIDDRAEFKITDGHVSGREVLHWLGY